MISGLLIVLLACLAIGIVAGVLAWRPPDDSKRVLVRDIALITGGLTCVVLWLLTIIIGCTYIVRAVFD